MVALTAANGPTQFWPGTHASLGNLPPPGAKSVTFAAPDEVHGAPGTFAKPDARACVARAGDAIVFDYRILHRGLANRSDAARPLAYFTYGRSWFKDATNYSATSLQASDPPAALPVNPLLDAPADSHLKPPVGPPDRGADDTAPAALSAPELPVQVAPVAVSGLSAGLDVDD